MSNTPLREKVRNLFGKHKEPVQQPEDDSVDGNALAGAVAAFTGQPTPHSQNPVRNVHDRDEPRRPRDEDQLAGHDRSASDDRVGGSGRPSAVEAFERPDQRRHLETFDGSDDVDRIRNSRSTAGVHEVEAVATSDRPRYVAAQGHPGEREQQTQSDASDVTDIQREIEKLKIDDGRDVQTNTPKEVGGVPVFENAEFTTVHRQYAPAVTHETVRHDVHEIREERIQREIHEHHVVTHILPVIDTQVLPARHFIRGDDGVEHEVSEAEAMAWEKSQGKTQTSIRLNTNRQDSEEGPTT